MEDLEKRITTLVESIVATHEDVNLLAKCFRDNKNTGVETTDLLYSAEFWRINTYGNALVRLRIILEQNFRFIETLGLVSVTRYIFELTLWLQLFKIDVNYSLVYHKRQIDVQRRYYQDTLSHHKREVILLKGLEIEDKLARKETIDKLILNKSISSEEISAALLKGSNAVDAKAARLFSIYTDQAQKNGYGYQAELLEKNTIPELQSTVEILTSELSEFDSNTSCVLGKLLGCAKWEKMAEEVNMIEEYEYIYSYTSKLLHCTPASITTDQKCLEPDEVIIFLRYIHTKIHDIIDLAMQQPECSDYVKKTN